MEGDWGEMGEKGKRIQKYKLLVAEGEGEVIKMYR